jgi:hypothetical protein
VLAIFLHVDKWITGPARFLRDDRATSARWPRNKNRQTSVIMPTYGRVIKRFDGVVGYRICLTHRRPPVRARVEPSFFQPKENSQFVSRFRFLHAEFCILFSDGQEQHGTCIFSHDAFEKRDDRLSPALCLGESASPTNTSPSLQACANVYHQFRA